MSKNPHEDATILAYLKSIEAKMSVIEASGVETRKKVEDIQRTLLIGRVAATVVTAILAAGWWLLEHSHLLSSLYFKIIEGKADYDNIRRNN